MSPLEFPGNVFDADGVSLVSGKSDLHQATIDAVPVKSIVFSTDPSNDAEGFTAGVGRVWLLDAGARFDGVPPAERYAVRALLRCGQGLLLLCPDEGTEAGVRTAILDLIEADDTPGGRFGHA